MYSAFSNGKCKGCSDKHEGCHDRCPYYVAQKIIAEEIYLLAREEKRKDVQMFDGIKRSQARNKGRRN